MRPNRKIEKFEIESLKKGHLTNRQFRELYEAGKRINIQVTKDYVGMKPVVNICDQQFDSFSRAAITLNHLAMMLPDNHLYLVG